MSEILEYKRYKKGEIRHIKNCKVVSIGLAIKKSIVLLAKVLLVE